MSKYKQSDMVDVVDAEGLAIPGLPQVPKAWLESKAGLVPPGTKKGKPKDPAADTSSASSSPAPTPRKPGEEPKGNASTEEWEAYAKEKGAKAEDLLDDKAEPLSRDALKEKFGAKA
jgi:hypothetical protein